MARIPTVANVSGPSAIKGRAPAGVALAVEDTSGLTRGVQNLAAGVNDAADSFVGFVQKERQRQVTSDLTAAEARWVKGSIDLENQFAQDGDFRTFDKRAKTMSEKLKTDAAAAIRDPRARKAWLDEAAIKQLRLNDSIGDRGRMLSHENDRVVFTNGLRDSSSLISDPSVPEPVRQRAREDIGGSIEMGRATGLISPAEADEFNRVFLEKADSALAMNLAKIEMKVDPHSVKLRLGTSSLMGGSDLANAAMATGGGMAELDPAVASMVAESLNDGAFPSDDALAAAYLKDPEVNARYTTAAMEMLTKRYKGDLTAAVIAAAPGGGEVLADAWVKSGHDEKVLPPKVRAHLKEVLTKFSPESDMIPLPVVAKPGVDLENVDVAVLDRWEKLQTVFGQTLPINSGYRDPDRNAAAGGAKRSMHIDRRAIDVDVSKLSKEDRIRLIENASAMGFTGIGVYNNSIHLDTGDRRAWGPSHGKESVPAWAQASIDQHVAGRLVEMPVNMRGVAPEFAALDFDQRIALSDMATAEIARQSSELRAGLQVVVENAPAAIMQTGSYGDDLPTADDFVQAFGAADGIDRYKTFQASVEVAETAWGMRTMNADDIAAVVEDAVPTSTGDMAAVEGKKFEAISAAAKATIEAREKDPASYVMETFPNVAEAWKGADTPEGLSAAITVTAEAQSQLGIENMKLLPAQLADQAAKTFNNTTLSEEERIGAITQTVRATQNDDYQQAIFDQLVTAGVPPHTTGAFLALERDDPAAATYLFRAAMVDPKVIGSKLPAGVTETDLNQRIREIVFDENQVGDVAYGLTNGVSENFERAGLDATLISRAASLHLLDGSAVNAEDAVKRAMKDVYGDVRVVTGKSWGGAAGVKILLGKDEDAEPLYQGFNALLPQVSDAAAADFTAGANPDMDPGMAAVFVQARTNFVDKLLSEGYFVGSERDGYVFIDPQDGQPVPGPDGEPMRFTKEAVLQSAAGAASAAEAADAADPYRKMALQGMFPEPTP